MFNEIFKYHKDGYLIRLSNGNKACKLYKGHGRNKVWCNGKSYLSHRVIWEMHNGPIPKGMEVDHKDINNLNNKIENLRLCTSSQNKMNRRKGALSKKLPKGVSITSKGKIRARITIESKEKHLGTFPTVEDAMNAYNKKAVELHGEFAVLSTLK